MPLQALAAAATLLMASPHGNRVQLALDRGSAELLWVSPATFRFRRVLDGALPRIAWNEGEAVAFELIDTASAVNCARARLR